MNVDFSKIIEMYNGLNVKFRYGIFIAVVFIVLLLDVVLLMAAQWRGIAKVDADYKTLTADIERVSRDKQRIDLLKKDLNQSRTQLSTMNSKIRPIEDVPNILDEISSIANDCNVKIDQLTPRKEEQESLIAATEGGAYCALPIVLRARSGYHMFGRFLAKLEGSTLYFTLKNLTIEANEKELNNHSFFTTINVILLDKSAAPPVVKKKQ